MGITKSRQRRGDEAAALGTRGDGFGVVLIAIDHNLSTDWGNNMVLFPNSEQSGGNFVIFCRERLKTLV